MTESTSKLQAPITVKVEVTITNGDGKVGTATLSLSPGRYPSEQAIRDSVARFEKESMPAGFRLMTKREWFDETFGLANDGEDDEGNPVLLRYAIPGGDEWED